ncbi:undecaprenyl-phosphate glucose phosphotransferase [Zhouia sp. PK063]|uniref:undecaprenyl-phosphate glucose phosphotransferase n=1 Tax=Zhouia sp. PK063 TaxID=3373602 RepID=UPI00379F6AD2
MKQYINKITFLSILADILVLFISYHLALYITPHISFFADFKLKVLLLVLLLCAWYVDGISNQLYKQYYIKRIFSTVLLKTFRGIAIQALLVVVFLFFSKSFLPNIFLPVYIGILIVLFSIEKYVFNKCIRLLRERGYNVRKVIMLGFGEASLRFYHLFQNNPQMGYHIVGYVDDTHKASVIGPWLGKIEDIHDIVQKYPVNEILITHADYSTQDIKALSKFVDKAGIRIRIIPDYHYHFQNKYEFKQFGNIPTVSLRKEPLEETHNKLMKRLFDIAFSSFVLVFICSWLFPLLAILVKLSSKGPVFFKQERMGRDRKPFYCLKFRSMAVNKDADQMQATKNDMRVTGIGKILRKTSLDEFPQFWNVFKGQMSIVGPRPHMMKHNEEYGEMIDNYLVRQLIKPGITGWAQINGYRGGIETDSDIKNRVAYDIWYLENWSFWLDVKIVYFTVWNVIKGEENAY